MQVKFMTGDAWENYVLQGLDVHFIRKLSCLKTDASISMFLNDVADGFLFIFSVLG